MLRKLKQFQDFPSYSYPADMVKIDEFEDLVVLSVKDISLHIEHLWTETQA